MVTIVKCPTCGTAVSWNEESPFRPFCSKRCQLIDLGEWANEEKRIPAQNQDPDGGNSAFEDEYED